MPTIAVFGAGSIGCYVGGRLLVAGNPVILIGRQRLADTLARHGLRLSSHEGWQAHADAASLTVRTEPIAVADANLVLVCVKSADTETAAASLRPHLKPGAVVISLQNGLHNADTLARCLPGHTVLAGMVPFNVAQLAPGHFHQGSEGELAVAASPALQAFLPAFQWAGLPLQQHRDMKAVQWAKLLLNLNNAVNALSGLPLKTELSQRDYRRVLAAAQREAIGLLQAEGQALAKLTPLPAHWLPTLLEVPDTVFRLAASRMLAIDPLARSSMQDDLAAGRLTEIDQLQGEIVALATAQGKTAPVNAALLALVNAAEKGGRRDWRGDELRQEVLS